MVGRLWVVVARFFRWWVYLSVVVANFYVFWFMEDVVVVWWLLVGGHCHWVVFCIRLRLS